MSKLLPLGVFSHYEVWVWCLSPLQIFTLVTCGMPGLIIQISTDNISQAPCNRRYHAPIRSKPKAAFSCLCQGDTSTALRKGAPNNKQLLSALLLFPP